MVVGVLASMPRARKAVVSSTAGAQFPRASSSRPGPLLPHHLGLGGCHDGVALHLQLERLEVP